MEGFDNRGVGATGGKTPKTVDEMAVDAIALGLSKVDLFGFSLGGGVAQVVALQALDLVRRLVLAGTGPKGGEGVDEVTKVAVLAYVKAAFTLKDPRHFLFFPRTHTGKAAAKEYFARLKERTDDRDKRFSLQTFAAQLIAIRAAGKSAPDDLSKITAPAVIANGDHDLMVASSNSVDMARRIPDSKLIIYPDSGHGGVFQHHQKFVAEVLAFLAD